MATYVAFPRAVNVTVTTMERTAAQPGELSSYGIGLSNPRQGEVRHYVTFPQEGPASSSRSSMGGKSGGAGARSRP
jgi:hypothetical protein